MVQKLGRLLILCGFDVRIIKTVQKRKDIKNLSEIAFKEKRILITRDTKILKLKNKSYYVLLKEQKIYNQMKVVFNTLKIKPKPELIFTRCARCNLSLNPIDKQEIKNLIPPITYKNTEEFYICNKCKKLYWKQSHYDFFLNKLKSICDTDDL